MVIGQSGVDLTVLCYIGLLLLRNAGISETIFSIMHLNIQKMRLSALIHSLFIRFLSVSDPT